MALINKIREKSAVTVIVITVGLLLFLVGGDVLRYFQGGTTERTVGEIAGQTIALEDYQREVDRMKVDYQLNYGRNPSEAEMANIRQQAWEMMIVKTAFQEQYDKLGIQVTDDELYDMVQGKNVNPQIMQAFSDPETGIFDRNRLMQFLQNFDQLPPQQQAAWTSLQNSLTPARLRLKYDNMLLKATYVTEQEAAMEYQTENATAQVKYAYVPYFSIKDSAVEVSDADLNNYIKEHEEQYKIQEGRTISYVTIPVTASPQDSASYKEELMGMKQRFAQAENDSVFANINTESGAAFFRVTIDQLPAELAENVDALNEGDVKGPYLLGNSYYLYKVSEIGQSDVAVAKARHILIKPNGTDDAAKAEAKKEARKVLREARSGADFAELAAEYSDGPTKTRGGDLGWFAEGRMVEEFNDAVFDAKRAGVINDVIETQFGFHIIKVEEPKTYKEFAIAAIRRDIAASDETIDEAYKKSDLFAASSGNYEEFKKNAEEMGLTIRVARDLGASDSRVGAIANGRPIVRWLYKEAAMNEVSEVFDIDNNYIIAVMTGRTEEGLAPLDKVKTEVARKVTNQKKAEKIKARISGATLDEIVANYGKDAKVLSSNDLTLNSNSLPGVGFAPEAVGVAFGLDVNELSEPIEADNGVVVIQLLNKTEAAEIADYSTYKQQLMQKKQSRASYNLSETVRDNADIEDKRYNFY